MAHLSLQQVKKHLRVDDDLTYEDELIELYMQAAETKAADFIDKQIYKSVDDVPEDAKEGHYVILNSAIKAAELLLIGHWYKNRESVVDGRVTEMPLSFSYIMRHYRRIGV